MAIYQFHFIGPNGERPALDFEEHDADGPAARAALGQLGRHDTCVVVEVWQDDRLILRHTRHPGSTLSAGTPLHGMR